MAASNASELEARTWGILALSVAVEYNRISSL